MAALWSILLVDIKIVMQIMATSTINAFGGLVMFIRLVLCHQFDMGMSLDFLLDILHIQRQSSLALHCQSVSVDWTSCTSVSVDGDRAACHCSRNAKSETCVRSGRFVTASDSASDRTNVEATEASELCDEWP